MYFNTSNAEIAAEVKERLNNIRDGKTPDKYGWMIKL